MEAILYKSITQKTVIKFIEENIIHRFGLPESITADQGTVFTRSTIVEFARSRGIKMVYSTSYYP